MRSETAISRGAVSVSSAAIEFAASLVGKSSGAGGGTALDNMHVVIIGAGKMARLLLVHLKSKGCRKITIVNRSPEKVAELKKEFSMLDISSCGMEEMWGAIATADIVYPSTASKTTIVNQPDLSNCMASRAKKDPLYFVDISVPRNVHEDCEAVDDVRVFYVDDLKSIVQRNTATRKHEMLAAEAILTEEMGKFNLWKDTLAVVPHIVALKNRVLDLHLKSVSDITKKCKDQCGLNPKQLEVISDSTKYVLTSLILDPISKLKRSVKARIVAGGIGGGTGDDDMYGDEQTAFSN